MQLDDFLKAYLVNGRVCPRPNYWQQVWKALPNRTDEGGSWSPSLPLILSAWGLTKEWEKKLRFREHLAWAVDHGAVDDITAILDSMDEGDWLHEGH